MEISCAFPPSDETVEHVVLAERLGYRRAWMYDSPALYEDVWVHLCRAAERTTRIGLGPAVLIPNLRHPLVTASAIATLARLAPERTAVAIGTGFTGRMALGQKPLPWAYLREHVTQLRALLRGDAVSVDGAMVQMIHCPGWALRRPIDVPIVIAANGPRGFAVAAQLGDGAMTIGGGNAAFDWCAMLAFGTVLDEAESAGSDRALAAAGAGLTVVFHAMYEGDPTSVDGLPNGAAWRLELEAVPDALRHLAVHEGHLVEITARDRQLLDGDLLKAFTWTGSADEVAGRLAGAQASGVTEILYAPMGPDVPRELATFADVAGIA